MNNYRIFIFVIEIKIIKLITLFPCRYHKGQGALPWWDRVLYTVMFLPPGADPKQALSLRNFYRFSDAKHHWQSAQKPPSKSALRHGSSRPQLLKLNNVAIDRQREWVMYVWTRWRARWLYHWRRFPCSVRKSDNTSRRIRWVCWHVPLFPPACFRC